MLAGNNDLADPFQLKGEAVRLLNRRMDDPVLSISDLTIGAVACLVLFEVSNTTLYLLSKKPNSHVESIWEFGSVEHPYGGTEANGQPPRRTPEPRPLWSLAKEDIMVSILQISYWH